MIISVARSGLSLLESIAPDGQAAPVIGNAVLSTISGFFRGRSYLRVEAVRGQHSPP